MAWLAFRIAFGIAVGLLLVGSLAGILLTGPVVVHVTPAELDIDASPARLRETVERLCTEFTPRSAEHPERLAAAAEWIAAQLGERGLAVERQEYRIGQRPFTNVVGRRAGSDDTAGIYVIGAHYDAYADHPGADDNASGVAVLLEVARTLPPARPRRTQLFVAFSTEEPPFFGSEQMGSSVFARSLVERGTPVELMISLDMVGYYSEEPGSQGFAFPGLGLFYPNRGDFIAIVGDLHAGPWIDRTKRGMMAMQTIAVHSLRASPSWAPVDLSDHWAFRQLGLPGVQVTDTAFMRFPHYHTAEDTPDRLDYERMAALVRALQGVLLEGPAGSN